MMLLRNGKVEILGEPADVIACYRESAAVYV